MNFYLIVPVSSVDFGGRYITVGTSIYHIYQQISNKTKYNVFRPSFFPNRYPWPRKKLTRKMLDKCFYSPRFCKSIEADDIDELVMEINMHSNIYKVVL